jgi:hypothetical protein
MYCSFSFFLSFFLSSLFAARVYIDFNVYTEAAAAAEEEEEEEEE